MKLKPKIKDKIKIFEDIKKQQNTKSIESDEGEENNNNPKKVVIKKKVI